MSFALLAVGAGACASSPALVAARKGDFASLQKDVAAEEKLGKLSNGEAADLAGDGLYRFAGAVGPRSG